MGNTRLFSAVQSTADIRPFLILKGRHVTPSKSCPKATLPLGVTVLMRRNQTFAGVSSWFVGVELLKALFRVSGFFFAAG